MQSWCASSQGLISHKRPSQAYRTTVCNAPNLALRRDFIIFQGQEMMPAWGSLLQGLRSGNVPWAEAHPAEAAAGRDFWGYLEVQP